MCDALEYGVGDVIALLQLELLPAARQVGDRAVNRDIAAIALKVEAGEVTRADRLQHGEEAIRQGLFRWQFRRLHRESQCPFRQDAGPMPRVSPEFTLP